MTLENPVYASFAARVAASFIDSILLMIVLLPLMSLIHQYVYSGLVLSNEMVAQISRDQSPSSLGALFFEKSFLTRWLIDNLLQLLLIGIILVFFWVRFATTPGKWLFRMRVVDAATGNAPTIKQSIIRYLGYALAAIPFFLGFFWIYFDKRRQGWHDKLANTVVIKRSRLSSTVQSAGP